MLNREKVNQIKNAIEKFCNLYPGDTCWPSIKDFLMDKPVLVHYSPERIVVKQYPAKTYYGWGWGRESGFNPQNYTWATYCREEGWIQISFKRGTKTISHVINLSGDIIEHHTSKVWIGWEDINMIKK